MVSAKSIIPKEIKVLCSYCGTLFIPFFCLFLSANAQDNSPYSRYGIGDIVPSTNITSRGMAGISSSYSDIISVNMNNPASFAYFQTVLEKNKKKSASGSRGRVSTSDVADNLRPDSVVEVPMRQVVVRMDYAGKRQHRSQPNIKIRI